MGRIHIVTDSSVRFLTPSMLELSQITVAPMTLRSGSTRVEEHLGADLQSVRILFEQGAGLPTAEPPSQELLAEIYGSIQKESNQILSIHTSSHLSRAVANAHAASQRFLGRSDIQVIDSQTISVGLGFLVQAAAEAVARGEDFEEVVRIIRGMIPRLYMVFFLDDLAFLEHNDLISRSQAILGNMLGIIAFLTLEEGRLMPMEKVRSRTRAIEKMVEFVSEFSFVEHLAILHSGLYAADEPRAIAERLRDLNPHAPISFSTYGPSLATIVGLRGIGVAVLEAEEVKL